MGTSLPYMLLMIALALYSAGYALRIYSTDAAGIYRSIRIVYSGGVFIGPLWVILALKFSGYDSLIRRSLYPFLFIVPLFNLAMVYTDSFHHLIYRGIDLFQEGPFILAETERGPLHFLPVLSNSIGMLCGTTLYLIAAFKQTGRLRKQSILMFFTSIVPWISYMVYRLGLSSYHINYMPFSFSLIAPLFGLFLFHFRLFDIIPIARSLVFETMNDPVLVLDMGNRIVDWNNEAETSFEALKPEQFKGLDIAELFKGFPEIQTMLESDMPGKKEIILGNGEHIKCFNCILIPIASRSGDTIGQILSFHDISAEKKLIEELGRMAATDALTEVFNRRKFLELCEYEIRKLKRNSEPLSIIMIDLDHFKKINDTLGHKAGDMVLQQAARRLNENLRSSNTLARYGGEEFIILLPGTGREDAMEAARRCCQSLAGKAVQYQDKHLHITASFGVYTSQIPERESLSDIISKADQAMYNAKTGGRNRVVAYEAGINPAAHPE